MELVDRQEAIKILQQIQDKRRKACGRAAIYEAQAIGYAITILQQLPAIETKPKEE